MNRNRTRSKLKLKQSSSTAVRSAQRRKASVSPPSSPPRPLISNPQPLAAPLGSPSPSQRCLSLGAAAVCPPSPTLRSSIHLPTLLTQTPATSGALHSTQHPPHPLTTHRPTTRRARTGIPGIRHSRGFFHYATSRPPPPYPILASRHHLSTRPQPFLSAPPAPSPLTPVVPASVSTTTTTTGNNGDSNDDTIPFDPQTGTGSLSSRRSPNSSGGSSSSRRTTTAAATTAARQWALAFPVAESNAGAYGTFLRFLINGPDFTVRFRRFLETIPTSTLDFIQSLPDAATRWEMLNAYCLVFPPRPDSATPQQQHELDAWQRDFGTFPPNFFKPVDFPTFAHIFNAYAQTLCRSVRSAEVPTYCDKDISSALIDWVFTVVTKRENGPVEYQRFHELSPGIVAGNFKKLSKADQAGLENFHYHRLMFRTSTDYISMLKILTAQRPDDLVNLVPVLDHIWPQRNLGAGLEHVLLSGQQLQELMTYLCQNNRVGVPPLIRYWVRHVYPRHYQKLLQQQQIEQQRQRQRSAAAAVNEPHLASGCAAAGPASPSDSGAVSAPAPEGPTNQQPKSRMSALNEMANQQYTAAVSREGRHFGLSGVTNPAALPFLRDTVTSMPVNAQAPGGVSHMQAQRGDMKKMLAENMRNKHRQQQQTAAAAAAAAAAAVKSAVTSSGAPVTAPVADSATSTTTTTTTTTPPITHHPATPSTSPLLPAALPELPPSPPSSNLSHRDRYEANIQQSRLQLTQRYQSLNKSTFQLSYEHKYPLADIITLKSIVDLVPNRLDIDLDGEADREQRYSRTNDPELLFGNRFERYVHAYTAYSTILARAHRFRIPHLGYHWRGRVLPILDGFSTTSDLALRDFHRAVLRLGWIFPRHLFSPAMYLNAVPLGQSNGLSSSHIPGVTPIAAGDPLKDLGSDPDPYANPDPNADADADASCINEDGGLGKGGGTTSAGDIPNASSSPLMFHRQSDPLLNVPPTEGPSTWHFQYNMLVLAHEQLPWESLPRSSAQSLIQIRNAALTSSRRHQRPRSDRRPLAVGQGLAIRGGTETDDDSSITGAAATTATTTATTADPAAVDNTKSERDLLVTKPNLSGSIFMDGASLPNCPSPRQVSEAATARRAELTKSILEDYNQDQQRKRDLSGDGTTTSTPTLELDGASPPPPPAAATAPTTAATTSTTAASTTPNPYPSSRLPSQTVYRLPITKKSKPFPIVPNMDTQQPIMTFANSHTSSDQLRLSLRKVGYSRLRSANWGANHSAGGSSFYASAMDRAVETHFEGGAAHSLNFISGLQADPKHSLMVSLHHIFTLAIPTLLAQYSPIRDSLPAEFAVSVELDCAGSDAAKLIFIKDSTIEPGWDRHPCGTLVDYGDVHSPFYKSPFRGHLLLEEIKSAQRQYPFITTAATNAIWGNTAIAAQYLSFLQTRDDETEANGMDKEQYIPDEKGSARKLKFTAPRKAALLEQPAQVFAKFLEKWSIDEFTPPRFYFWKRANPNGGAPLDRYSGFDGFDDDGGVAYINPVRLRLDGLNNGPQAFPGLTTPPKLVPSSHQKTRHSSPDASGGGHDGLDIDLDRISLRDVKYQTTLPTPFDPEPTLLKAQQLAQLIHDGEIDLNDENGDDGGGGGRLEQPNGDPSDSNASSASPLSEPRTRTTALMRPMVLPLDKFPPDYAANLTFYPGFTVADYNQIQASPEYQAKLRAAGIQPKPLSTMRWRSDGFNTHAGFPELLSGTNPHVEDDFGLDDAQDRDEINNDHAPQLQPTVGSGDSAHIFPIVIPPPIYHVEENTTGLTHMENRDKIDQTPWQLDPVLDRDLIDHFYRPKWTARSLDTQVTRDYDYITASTAAASSLDSSPPVDDTHGGFGTPQPLISTLVHPGPAFFPQQLEHLYMLSPENPRPYPIMAPMLTPLELPKRPEYSIPALPEDIQTYYKQLIAVSAEAALLSNTDIYVPAQFLDSSTSRGGALAAAAAAPATALPPELGPNAATTQQQLQQQHNRYVTAERDPSRAEIQQFAEFKHPHQVYRSTLQARHYQDPTLRQAGNDDGFIPPLIGEHHRRQQQQQHSNNQSAHLASTSGPSPASAHSQHSRFQHGYKLNVSQATTAAAPATTNTSSPQPTAPIVPPAPPVYIVANSSRTRPSPPPMSRPSGSKHGPGHQGLPFHSPQSPPLPGKPRSGFKQPDIGKLNNPEYKDSSYRPKSGIGLGSWPWGR